MADLKLFKIPKKKTQNVSYTHFNPTVSTSEENCSKTKTNSQSYIAKKNRRKHLNKKLSKGKLNLYSSTA